MPSLDSHTSKTSGLPAFNKLSHAIRYYQYHIVWTSKYRYKILTESLKVEVEKCIRMFAEQLSSKIEELNVQIDHVHMVIMVPPKISISELVGTIKGRCAIRIFKNFPKLRQKLYWGNHFWAPGYYVDTVGMDFEKICKYVRYQEKKEKYLEFRG